MKQYIALSLVVLLAGLLPALAIAPSQEVSPGRVDAEAHNVDNHQVVYGTVYNYGSGSVFTISNGDQGSPLWLNVHFQFIDGNGGLIEEVVRGGWCEASLGGSARKCDCRFTAGIRSDTYSTAARIKMFGERRSAVRRSGSGGCI